MLALHPHRRTKRRIGWMLLATMMIAVMGIPEKQPVLKGDAIAKGERFPCEHCACGCVSAAHCWDKCCCHTDAEKLQWAERNGVTPPLFLARRVAEADRFESLVASTAPSKPTCCKCSASAANPSGDPGIETVRFVLLWKAAECRGLKSLWSLLSVALAIEPKVMVAMSDVIVERRQIADEHASSVSDRPTPPVP